MPRLRADALKAKTEAESTLARATAEAEGIMGQAREEAENGASPQGDGEPRDGRRAAPAAGTRPHQPGRGPGRRKDVRQCRRRWPPPAPCCASRSAAARLRRWSTRRLPSCRTVCTDFSNIGSPAKSNPRAHPGDPRGAFFVVGPTPRSGTQIHPTAPRGNIGKMDTPFLVVAPKALCTTLDPAHRPASPVAPRFRVRSPSQKLVMNIAEEYSAFSLSEAILHDVHGES